MLAISVIITTHNRISSLKEALTSVNNQTVIPNEVIVVNDGRKFTDSLKNSLIDSLDNIFLKIVETQGDKGACHARNLGADASTSSIIMFLDDDDSWEPQKIDNQKKIFNDYPNVGLVYTGKKVVFDSDRNTVVRKISAKKNGYLYPEIFKDNYIGTTSSVAIRKQVFLDAGGFDERLPAMQDYDLWIRCCKLTNVKSDEEYNIKYTISESLSNQISMQSNKHKTAVEYIFKKYNNEVKKLPGRLRRNFVSTRYLHFARATHRTNYIASLPLSYKSFINYPNKKSLALFIPNSVIIFLLKGKSRIKYKGYIREKGE